SEVEVELVVQRIFRPSPADFAPRIDLNQVAGRRVELRESRVEPAAQNLHILRAELGLRVSGPMNGDQTHALCHHLLRLSSVGLFEENVPARTGVEHDALDSPEYGRVARPAV